MCTTSKVFLDSLFFTEGFKGRDLDYYHYFTTNPRLECYINAIVCSEHWYNLPGLIGGSAPLSLKEGRRISATVNVDISRFLFFKDFCLLPTEENVIAPAFTLMPKYNLLSNDALILASCIVEQISYIASHNSDFEIACKA